VTGLAPTHIPLLHVSVLVQALPSSQTVPVVGMHVPVVAEQSEHAPHDGVVLCQTPVLEQLCGCWPLQRVEPGVHAPVQLPPLQMNSHAGPVFIHVPVASQV
jgi:hypothetical protein